MAYTRDRDSGDLGLGETGINLKEHLREERALEWLALEQDSPKALPGSGTENLGTGAHVKLRNKAGREKENLIDRRPGPVGGVFESEPCITTGAEESLGGRGCRFSTQFTAAQYLAHHLTLFCFKNESQ